MTPPELRALLADSLALWGVEGRTAVDGGGVVVAVPGGITFSIRPAMTEDRPIRWWLERPGQRRPCTSVTGLLRSLRNSLGAGEDEGIRRLRVAAGG